MAKIEIDSRVDSPAVIRAIAEVLETVANDKDAFLARKKERPANQVADPHTEKQREDDTDDGSMFNNAEAAGLGNEREDRELSTAGHAAGDAPAAHSGPVEGGPVDHNGVTFDPEFCSKAAKPFYASGPRKGQWKKRQGVDEQAYDDWYNEALADVPEDADDTEDDALDTQAAFGGAKQETATATAAAAPATVGDFMAYVSELTAAQRITQDQVGACYEVAGVEITDLFPPNEPPTVAENLAAVYAEIQKVVNA